jgi:molybdenum cofactor cytidylyltransferase
MTGGVSAVILAAGSSDRMGEPKQLLRLGELTMIERVLKNVRCSGADEIVLVLGASAEEIQRQVPCSLLAGVKVVVNSGYAEGMAGSLREGLDAIAERMAGALVVLADQPFVRAETMNRIISAYRGSQAKIAIPHYEGKRGNPVLLDRSIFAEAMALEGDTGCRAIFRNHPEAILEVDVEDEGIVLDMDSPEDYERLRTKRN